jgi:hypothetical protein
MQGKEAPGQQVSPSAAAAGKQQQAQQHQQQQQKQKRSSSPNAADTKLGVSPSRQAAIPEVRPRPAQPTPAEARLLPAPLYSPSDSSTSASASSSATAAKAAAKAASAFKASYRAARDGAARRRLIAVAVRRANDKMGEQLVQVRLRACFGVGGGARAHVVAPAWLRSA